MEPITALAFMGAVQAAGGLLNFATQQGYNEQQLAAAQRLYEQAQAIAEPKLQTPEYQEYKAISPYEVKGYTPQLLPPSEVGAMGIDEGMRSRQLQALDELQRIYQEGGLDPQSQAAINQAQMQANAAAQAQRAGVQAQAQRAGRGGTVLDYIMQQQAGQDAANRLNQASLDAAANARMRALEAMGAFQSGAANLREQDFGQKQTAAQARDVYNRFNTEMMNDALKYKIDLENQRAKSMFGAAQDIAKQNVDLRNRALDERNRLAQQRFQNQLDKLRAGQGAESIRSTAQQQQLQSQQKAIGDIAGGIAGGIGSYASYQMNKDLLDRYGRPKGVVDVEY